MKCMNPFCISTSWSHILIYFSKVSIANGTIAEFVISEAGAINSKHLISAVQAGVSKLSVCQYTMYPKSSKPQPKSQIVRLIRNKFSWVLRCRLLAITIKRNEQASVVTRAWPVYRPSILLWMHPITDETQRKLCSQYHYNYTYFVSLW